MSHHVVFVFKNSDGTVNFHHECVVATLPKVGDLVGVEGAKDKLFKTAVARVETVLLTLYIAEATIFQNRALIVTTILKTLETALTVEGLVL